MEKLTKNYFINVLNQVITFIIPLILIPYVSRVLGAENIGTYSYYLSIVTIFASIGKLGINTYGQIQISKSRDDYMSLRNTFLSLMILRILSMFVVSFAYNIFALLFLKNSIISLMMGLFLLGEAIDISWFFQGLEDFKRIALRNLFIKLLNILLIIILVNSKDDFYVYIIIMQLSAIMANMSLWFGLYKRFSLAGEKRIDIRFHLKSCFVYFIPTVANIVYNVMDKTMLGALGKSAYESGCYEQAYKIISVSKYCLLALGITTLPRLTYLYNEHRANEVLQIITTSVKILSLLVFPMSVGIFLTADKIIPLFLGQGYEAAIRILRILSILMIFAVFNYTIGNQIYVSCGEQKKYNIAVIVGAISNFVLNMLLIKTFKGTGAAMASLMAEIIIFIIFVCWSDGIDVLNIIRIGTCKYIVPSIMMGLVIFGCDIIANGRLIVIRLILQIVLAIPVYFGILFWKKDEIALLFAKKILIYLKIKKKDS